MEKTASEEEETEHLISWSSASLSASSESKEEFQQVSTAQAGQLGLDKMVLVP